MDKRKGMYTKDSIESLSPLQFKCMQGTLPIQPSY